MRKPLAALSLALGASLGAPTAAQVLAAQTASTHLNSSHSNSSVSPRNSSPARLSNNVSGAAIVRKGLQYIGYPYTTVGDSPATGFSCIGFASYVYRSLGIPLPGDLQDALDYAPQVAFSQLEPGDLLYFQNTIWNGLSHVAIYIGGGKFVHAEWYNRGVRVSQFNNDPVDGNYWIQHYMTANRPWGGVAGTTVVTPPAGGSVKTPSVTTTNTLSGPQSAVTVPALNVRSGPSMKNSVVTVISKGSSVTVLHKGLKWTKVQLSNGTIGWVVSYGIGLSAASPSTTTVKKVSSGLPKQPTRAGFPTAAAHHRLAAVKVTGLNVHSGPSINAGVLTSLPKGEKVAVLGLSGKWLKVETTSGQIGWVYAPYTSGGAKKTATTVTKKVTTQITTAPKRTTSRVSLSHYAKTRSTVPGLRIHTSPSIGAPVISALALHQKVAVLSTSGGWDKIETAAGVVGWVDVAYTSRTSAPARVSKVAAKGYSGAVITAGVRVHSRPGLNAPVTTMAGAGTHVRVLGKSGSWTLVRLPSGRTGYVYSTYVQA